MKEIYKTYHTLQGRWSFFAFAVIKSALDALSTVDGQCCQDGLVSIDMKKGPNRRCHSSYQHPLGRPLSLTLVNDNKWCAALVDPYDGVILFAPSVRDYFDCFDKSGRWRGRAAVDGRACTRVSSADGFGGLMENKSRSLLDLLCDQIQRNQHPSSIIMTNRTGA